MKDNVLFLNMFALYEPSSEAAEQLACAVIRGAELDPVERRISLDLGCEAPIPGRLLAEICREVEQVYTHPMVYQYIVALSQATRQSPYLSLGLSPRASLAAASMARAIIVLPKRRKGKMCWCITRGITPR